MNWTSKLYSYATALLDAELARADTVDTALERLRAGRALVKLD